MPARETPPSPPTADTASVRAARSDAVVALLCALGALFLGPLTGLPAIRLGQRARRGLPRGDRMRAGALLAVSAGWLSVLVTLGMLAWLGLSLTRPAQTMRQFEERRLP